MVYEFFSALPYGNYVFAALVVAASIVAAKVAMLIFERTLIRATSKTKTMLDDAIIHAIRKPLYIAVILVGTLFAVDSLNVTDAYIGGIRHVLFVVWVMLGAYALNGIVAALFQWYSAQISAKTATKFDDTISPIIRKILSVFIYAIALMIILKGFGVDITPLVAGLGIGVLAIALALQDTLSNLFSGTFMAPDRAIKSGDFVELENGTKGYVEEIGWRSTKIRTLPNNFVIIPNSKLANSVITDYSAPQDEMAVVVQVGVGYGSDLEKVERVTVDVAKKVQTTVEGAVRDFEPFIRYHTFGDSNINFSVILRVQKYVDQYLMVHEFIKVLKNRYDKEGIEISFQVRKIVGAGKERHPKV